METTKHACEKSWFEKLKPEEISERLSEFQIFQQQEVFRKIVEEAYEGIGVAQGDKFCFINKRMMELTGRTREELLTISFIENVHPDDRAKTIDLYTRRLKNEDVPNTYPLRIMTKDGEVKWVQITANTIRWKGQPAVLGLVTDISAQKKLEEGLRESEEKYRRIVSNSVLGIYETNLAGEILYLNDAMLNIFEWDSTQGVIGGDITKIYRSKKQRDDYLEILKRNGRVKNFGLDLITANGKSKHVLATATLSGDRISGTLMDITERKKHEKELNTLINATHDMALLIEPDGTVVTINKQAANSLKKNPDELLGRSIFQFMPQDIGQYRKNVLDEMLLSKRPAQHIEQHRGRYYVTNLFPIIDDKGNVEQMTLFIKEITELKRAEKALVVSEKRYRDMVNNAPVGIYETDLKGDILYVNDAMAKIFEFDSPAAMLRASAVEGYKDKKLRKVFTENLKRNGKIENFMIEAVTPAGKTKYVNISAILEGDKINGMIIDISELKQAEKKLKNVIENMESLVAERTEELQLKTRHLVEANTALKVLLEKRNEDKNELEEKILTNVKQLVLPYLEKAKRKTTGKKLHTYLDILETNLTNIISPFSNKLSTRYMNLTPAEIQVADLVKHGKGTKEIADLLQASAKTVETHRVNIRKKLGLTNKRANLRTYLLSIENG
jgi:PAS domain S-box-containing protein